MFSIKESISKFGLSTQSSVFQESISQLISSIEENIKAKFAPILELVLRLPTNAPRVLQLSQGGDKGYSCIGSSKDSEKEAVVGKVMSTKIPISLLISVTKNSTRTTTGPIKKGIVINETDRGSSLNFMPPPSKDDQGDKVKGITLTLSEEEKKRQHAL
ncbi:unnamed protein product [Lactuca saligna]|uniref:Uncharacterized protein n=1 Tax=Lactuca saligna TaxID=75948 RepID=A0AA36ENJ8_LACSI|nr:unnamed protein product [Lactuca saligna]